VPLVASAIHDVESVLGDQGRVLVRASGTEPLIRVMVEGQNEQDVQAHAESIASAVRDSEPATG
jgi:phosphoglucosamine mutase